MLEDQVAYLLQRYLGNYVRGLNKEALKISVWRGDVELTNMQLKPEALNALELPVKVKAGFLGSVKLKVPWSRLGQEPVVVYLDSIFLLAEPATQVEGRSEDVIQEVKKSRIREMETKLLESAQQAKAEMNTSWMGSLINTIIGNLKLSISNIHIRYEDLESNPGHPFAAGVTLEKLSAVTVDDSGRETFLTGGGLERIQKSGELEGLAVYFDSDICPWHVDKPWDNLLPQEWSQIFEFGTKDGKPTVSDARKHAYMLQPVTGNAKYSKQRPTESANSGQPMQKAVVVLDDVTLCLSKNGYRDILKLAENFSAFNQRLKYAHYHPLVSVKSDPRSWWKYACKCVSDEIKKASGRLSWEQVLRYAGLRKRYISLYASLLKSEPTRAVVDDNKEIEELDRELDIELILQWRMLAHKFVEQSTLSGLYPEKNTKKSWWSFGWSSQSDRDDNEAGSFTEEDWKRLSKIIGYKESDDGQSLMTADKGDVLRTSLEIHMKHNASKLNDDGECLAELSCDDLDCLVKIYSEAKVFDVKLGSYQLSSTDGLLAQSATACDSLAAVFCYKPFDAQLDWSMVAKASPCYMMYLKDSVDRIVKFFESNAAVSQTLALETAAAVQVTFDEVKRSAQQQMNRALKDHTRFLLDLDIAAPKITVPTDFCPDNIHPTKLLLDLGNLTIRNKDEVEWVYSPDEMHMYFQFDLVLSDVSAFLVDGDYHWGQSSLDKSAGSSQLGTSSFLPVIEKCGVVLRLQQIRLENPSYPSTRLAVRLPSLGFHFSPARYHRLMQIVKIFQGEDSENANLLRPWNQADFEGWLSLLTWKGVGSREALWQRRYLCLVGPFLYVLENPDSKSYKHYLSLRGKQQYQVPADMVGNAEHVLAICDAARSNNKVVEDANAIILRCDSDDSRRTWQNRLQGSIYRASGSAPIMGLSETPSDSGDSDTEVNIMNLSKENFFMTGVLDELKVCFGYTIEPGQSFLNVLLAEERCLIEFRAIGGRVEISTRANAIFIGTVLKALEVVDLVSGKGFPQPCYLARSFIRSTNAPSVFNYVDNQSYGDSQLYQSEGDDKFYEASDDLYDSPDSQPPNFTRVAGVLPGDIIKAGSNDMEVIDALDTFVKAQIIIYDQNSALYTDIDKRVTVTLATLSFFCRRPTILAIMEFVNAINIEDESCESFSDNSPTTALQHGVSEDAADQQSAVFEEPIVKGLLGKGKSRIMFYLTLNMARAQILLMKENGTKLSTLSQDNLITDIKVFPSSFSIKASLGNLRMSDDSLDSNHLYFWACDMRNPGGSSFVELAFSSFSANDEDYEGYEYSLLGQLSEVRVVFLNRFIQEIISYFMGLVPNNSIDVVKVKDQSTSSEKLFTTGEIEGSPAVKLDLSLRKPIILMPRRTDSLDYLKLDVVHITVRNTFRWFGSSKKDMNAVHMDILTVLVEDINLNVGIEAELGESIIQDVKGVSIVIRRSLRDLLHQIPSTEVAVKIEKLKAALSNREYQIITDCAMANFSETPNNIPPLENSSFASTIDVIRPLVPEENVPQRESKEREKWINMKVLVDIDLVEFCLHYGIASDASLATVRASGLWLLYKSNTLGDGFLSATLEGFTVVDDREGTEQELRLAIQKPENIGYNSPQFLMDDHVHHTVAVDGLEQRNKPVPSMLILDAKFSQYSSFISLCIQRPQLLVALDFLLAVVEFFVPTVGSMLSNEGDDNSDVVDAIILDHPTYSQPSAEFALSSGRPLIVDDERFDHFIYDGRGGILYLKDRRGSIISSPSVEAIIYVGSGKRLQFKNVTIKNGKYLDSSISLGSKSSYSALEDDQVFLKPVDSPPNSLGDTDDNVNSNVAPGRLTEFTIELQAIGPELTFYNASKDIGKSTALSNKLLHAQLDAFCRLVMKGDTMEMGVNGLGLMLESNGIRILEPFDTCVKFSNASGKTTIHLEVSDIFMNFSFSILRLFLAVEEDILAFMRMTSKKMTLVCSEFDKIGTIRNPCDNQTYTFWRPHAPPGFAVLGDYLTPIDKPPTKGVLAVNASFVRVKRPESFKQVWPASTSDALIVHNHEYDSSSDVHEGDASCSIWFPEAPKGYVALGCVVSPGRTPPAQSSVFCILASLVSPAALRDCITILSSNLHPRLAFWRVDNSFGTFLPADSISLRLNARAYELRHIFFGFPETSSRESMSSDSQAFSSGRNHSLQSERSSTVNSGRRIEAVASFLLVWWNQGSGSRKKLSIWRPVVPEGSVYFGDIAVQGYEPPNACIVLRDSQDDEIFKAPVDFQLVGQIKKRLGKEILSFWLPQAPPGFVALGCVACKGTPKQSDFSSLRCIRSDMVTGDQFLEESIWDTSDAMYTRDPFSIWTAGNDLGTFVVRGGFKKPPKRFAVKLADPNIPSSSDDVVIDAEFRTFSAALFDDYGGLMVPLCNISLSSVGFSLHGRPDYLSSSVGFSLVARSYNDKYEAWEPLVEPVDGLLRYQYDLNSPAAASQLRLTNTRDLNLNVSVSNANMIIQAYQSWDNLGRDPESYRGKEAVSPTSGGKPILDVHQKRNYFIIPQNNIGQDIFMRATEINGFTNIIKMPSGDTKPLKVPVSKNMLNSHLKGDICKKLRAMVTIIIADGELPMVDKLSSRQYAVAVRLTLDQSSSGGSLMNQQSARTRGSSSDNPLSSDIQSVEWNEIFFFKVDSPDFYVVELVATDMGTGNPIGYFSAPLKQMVCSQDNSYPYTDMNDLTWIELSQTEYVKMTPVGKLEKKSCGRIRCSAHLSPRYEAEGSDQSYEGGGKSGSIQISPTRDGPWTDVRLNYAASAACWQFGNDVVASEVSVKDGNRYVNIRSLVSVRNNTDFALDLCLRLGVPDERTMSQIDARKHTDAGGSEFETDEFFETERYNPPIGWVSSVVNSNNVGSYQGEFEVDVPSGWEWIDDWHVDKNSVNTADGWVYAPQLEILKWPESFDPLKFVNYARQRKWIRNRKRVSKDIKAEIFIGPLKPGEAIPIPLQALTQSGLYTLQLKPSNHNNPSEYAWSTVMKRPGQLEDTDKSKQNCEIFVSTLTESEELLYCSEISGTSSGSLRGMWFCLTIQATEIARDIQSDPIQDWSLVVKSPLSLTNYLPLTAEFSVLEMQTSGHFLVCDRGIFGPGETVKVYNVDIRNGLYFSLLPQKGWLPIHEAVLISHPSRVPSRTISLRSSITGRIVQIILEHNDDKGRPLQAKIIRVYSPFWLAIARCPPLTFRLLDMAGRKPTRRLSLPFHSKKKDELILEEITEEELYDGCTIDSSLNFKFMSLSASISQLGNENFGPVIDLSPLGDMDGSVDVCADGADGNCMRLFISSKPSPYQSVPTKVISVRPFMTFTNRLGQNIFIKLSSEDEPKTLHTSDTRVSFLYHETVETNKLQVRLEDTEWSFPVQIMKEDAISLVLRKHDGKRRFLRTEIRGYEEGSRFVVVFRVGSTHGPIRIENRSNDKIIRVCQSGFSDGYWIQLEPLSTINFAWEDPYGQKSIDAEIHGGSSTSVAKLELDKLGIQSVYDGNLGLSFHVFEIGKIKVARFVNEESPGPSSNEGNGLGTHIGIRGNSLMQSKMPKSVIPFELIVELGVLGVSFVDHRPKELSYLYLERVFVCYSTGYDGGTTSRFKLILGHLQLDNQLPLTLMPVLLAPEQTSDLQRPVFKITVTMRNENPDGIQVYPYVYIRVTEKGWRLNIHEPIIWAFVDFYRSLRLDRIPKDSNVTQVDPEIRVDLIDVSEVRLKVSLETAPAQRPHGLLGVWSPILSAVGNAFKIQIHLRKVMHKDRFMRKSSVVPAIGNRIWRDLIHNPLHLIFSVDVLGMTSSTLASLSKGFAELSTDGQFLQLRSKQVWSRRITGVGDGLRQGTEALAQGVVFGVSGVVTKPVESARQNGLLGLAHGLGRAFLGFIVQPMSGALDFFSLTVDGVGASCSRCLEILNNKTTFQRIRNPRAIRADNILREYCEQEAVGQMILYIAEGSRHFVCTEIFKEPSKFALSDYYEDHFLVPYQRIVLVTNKRVMLLQCLAPDKMDKKPSKIMWDVPWEELMALELAKAGHPRPSHLILHLKNFRRSESFVRVIKCHSEELEEREPQAVTICSVVCRMWKGYQLAVENQMLKAPSNQRHRYGWSEAGDGETRRLNKVIIKTRELPSSSSMSNETKFVKHAFNFSKVWSSEQESKGRCSLCQKQVSEDSGICSIWRPICPAGYVSIGDVARIGDHPPNVAAVYLYNDKLLSCPVGYDLVWRNCRDDYTAPVSIWLPRAPEGYISPGCVAVPSFIEPEPNFVYCVAESLAEQTVFEERKIWSASDSYPWACHIYQVRSDALHFVALRQPREESDWKPMRVLDDPQSSIQPSG